MVSITGRNLKLFREPRLLQGFQLLAIGAIAALGSEPIAAIGLSQQVLLQAKADITGVMNQLQLAIAVVDRIDANALQLSEWELPLRINEWLEWEFV